MPPADDGPGRRQSPGSANAISNLSQAIRRITATTSVKSTLEAIAGEARWLIGAHQAVASLTLDGSSAQRITGISLSERYAAWRDYDIPPDGTGIYSRVCATNRPMRLNQAQLQAHPAWKAFGAEAERHPPLRGWLAAPLVGRDGANIGLVQLSDKYGSADFSESDEHVLVELADIAAIAVENANLYEAADRSRAESEQRLREVQTEQAKLAEVFRNAPSFMCILGGPDHVFERANEQYQKLVGHRPIIGKPVVAALPEIRHQGFIELLDHVYRTRETYVGHDVRIELAHEQAGGRSEIRWLDFVYQPLHDASGAITGVYVQGIDLTERKRVEEELRESEQRLRDVNASLEARVAARTEELEARAAQLRALAAELNQAEQRERRRIGDILHDHLQQLLVAGRMQLEGLAADAKEPQQAQRIRRVDQLIGQAIDESRSLTADLFPPVLYDAGLAMALQSLARWIGSQYGLHVEVVASERADPAGEDLRMLLYQSVRELLLNVVKHAEAERAEVNLQRLPDEQVEVTVTDWGEGFDSAAEIPTPSTAGFGLFGIRERVAWVGGELTIDSAPGRGTRARLRIPDQVGDADRDSPQAGEAQTGSALAAPTGIKAEGSAGNTTVVLADDHAIVREGLAKALAAAPDITVVGEAADGREALELVRRVRPDVVVLDVSMPHMSGIEAARTITAELPQVRVIGLSVHASDEMAVAMQRAGGVAHLNKAQASDRLLAVIRREANRDVSDES